MTRRRWWLLALAVGCLSWALGGEWVSIHHGVSENHFLDLLGGLAFLGCGIITLDRRPRNVIGPLMIAYGINWYFGNWGNLNVPVLTLLGVSIGQWAGLPILAHIALSYPAGRLRTMFDRAVIAVLYAAAIIINLVILLVFDPRSSGCASTRVALAASATAAPTSRNSADCSSTSARMPWRRNSRARVSPPTPAPTIMTGGPSVTKATPFRRGARPDPSHVPAIRRRRGRHGYRAW
jgi:hypothetical protein